MVSSKDGLLYMNVSFGLLLVLFPESQGYGGTAASFGGTMVDSRTCSLKY